MDFRILVDREGTKKFPLDSQSIYKVLKDATHLHLRAGKVCFGVSKSERYINKTNRGKFFKIPKILPGILNVNAVSFPRYVCSNKGHDYSYPEWHGAPVL